MESPIDWLRFADIIRSSSRVLLTAHQRPDGDCLGSELAMRLILLALGKEVRIINPHPVPPTLAFLDKTKSIKSLEDWNTEDQTWLNHADLFFVLDTSSWTQLGQMAPIFKTSHAQKLVLDHHAKGDHIGAECFIDPKAEATGILVVRAADALKIPLTQEIAEAVFVAISTDTGWFRFSSVNAETYRTAARLIDTGVVPAHFYRELYEQESLGRIRLIGQTLAQTESHFNGKLMLVRIMLHDFDTAGALSSDSEDIVNMALQVKDSQMAVLISELRDKSFKISFRSRCAIDCSSLAAQFGGGGHKQAAGALSNLPYEKTKQAILQAIENIFDHQISTR
ncbi:MAG: bifunctional oligoribonuclease/PAP phosphatase NrnA [Planctomycetaceae bacterium]|jgi:phosphoesterase RecJ-like protein|nr:bifunctional oligoribonuclease/PAP phosphatase NrnA [Planctomycetaceae bacterium]